MPGPPDLRPGWRPSPAVVLGEALVLLVPVAWLAVVLREALVAPGLWGTADPWGNGDFIGNFWCWWQEGERWSSGRDWGVTLGWPAGGEVQAFPNRLDAWIALLFSGGSMAPDAFAPLWNRMAALHLGLAAATTALAARLAGAGRLPAAAGSLLLASSPTLLHELAGGRMATFIVWPGILALGLAAGSRRARGAGAQVALGAGAGLALGVQLLGYPYHAAVAALVAVPLLAWPRQERGAPVAWILLAAAAGLLVVLPASGDLWSAGRNLAQGPPPPDGYTSLPLEGLLGGTGVPERFRVLPGGLLLLGAALVPRASRRWALAGLAILVLAVGPHPTWSMDGRWVWPPVERLLEAVPLLRRMHHPVRAAPLGLATSAVALALALQAVRPSPLRVLLAGGVGALTLLGVAPLQRVTTWRQADRPPGIEVAAWLHREGTGPVVDLLSGTHRVGLALQPWHRLPLLETAGGYEPPPGRSPAPGALLRARIPAALALDPPPDAGVLEPLRAAGFHHLLLVPRPGREAAAQRVTAWLESHLGPPAHQGTDGAVWTIAQPQVPDGPQTKDAPAP